MNDKKTTLHSVLRWGKRMFHRKSLYLQMMLVGGISLLILSCDGSSNPKEATDTQTDTYPDTSSMQDSSTSTVTSADTGTSSGTDSSSSADTSSETESSSATDSLTDTDTAGAVVSPPCDSILPNSNGEAKPSENVEGIGGHWTSYPPNSNFITISSELPNNCSAEVCISKDAFLADGQGIRIGLCEVDGVAYALGDCPLGNDMESVVGVHLPGINYTPVSDFEYDYAEVKIEFENENENIIYSGRPITGDVAYFDGCYGRTNESQVFDEFVSFDRHSPVLSDIERLGITHIRVLSTRYFLNPNQCFKGIKLIRPYEKCLSPCVMRVDPNATGTGDGQSWTNAYTSLYDGLEAATAQYQACHMPEKYCEVWVAQGRYKPATIDPRDSRNVGFRVADGVRMYGGFVASETLLDERDTNPLLTVIDGNTGNGDNFADNLPDLLSISAFGGVDGFIIMKGYSVNRHGAVIILNNGWLSNSVIFQNMSATDPFAQVLYNKESGTLENVAILGNTGHPLLNEGHMVNVSVSDNTGDIELGEGGTVTNITTKSNEGSVINEGMITEGEITDDLLNFGTVSNSVIRRGLFNNVSTGIVQDSVLLELYDKYNQAGASPIYNSGTIKGCIISGNFSGDNYFSVDYGGTIKNNGYGRIHNSIIQGNRSKTVILRQQDWTILDNTIVAGNQSKMHALYAGPSANEDVQFRVLQNITVFSNYSSGDEIAMLYNGYFNGDGPAGFEYQQSKDLFPLGFNPDITNFIIWNNSPTTVAGEIGYSNIEGATENTTTGIISASPQFATVDSPSGTWRMVSYNEDTFQTTLSADSILWTPDALVGTFIQPDVTDNRMFVIVANTPDTVTLWGDLTKNFDSGEVYVEAGATFEIVDLHLSASSPCIDAGYGLTAPKRDMDENWRYDNASVTNTGVGPTYPDLGAYEFGIGQSATDHFCGTPIYFEDTAHYYWACSNSLSWQDAQTYCAGMGANLVSINDENENTFVASQIQHSAWIGGYEETETVWRWVDTSPLDAYPAELLEGFDAWESDRPWTTLARECISVNPENAASNGGQWVDLSCDIKQHYVCEFGR